MLRCAAKSVFVASLVFAVACECDADTISDSCDSISLAFAITNTTAEAQSVSSVVASCGCLAPEDIEGREIAPGSVLPFNVTLNPEGLSGRLSKTVSVTLSPSGEMVVFPIELFVRVRLAFDRRDAAFGVVSGDADARTISLRLRGTAAELARIVSVEAPPQSEFKVAVVEDRRGVVVSLPSDDVRRTLGTVAETWKVKTDDAEVPEIRLPVSAIFESRISVSPAVLYVSADEPVCSRTVLLLPKGDTASFKVLSAATKPRHWGDATVTARPLGGWMVRIDGIDPDAVRQFSRNPCLEIATDLPGGETIAVPLRVLEGGIQP